MSRFTDLARLMRLPNVFTAFADIAMAFCVVWTLSRFDKIPWLNVLCLFLASGCLYIAGMIWNDFFDRKEDAKVRSFRPIPSGRVTVKLATILGSCFVFAGLLAAFFASGSSPLTAFIKLNFQNSFLIAVFLTIAIFLYNAILKHTALGPIGMGLCRFLNVLLGLSWGNVEPWLAIHLAAIVGLYIVGVTLFARTEEYVSRKLQLSLAAFTIFAALIVAVFVPLWLNASSVFFIYLLVAFGFIIAQPIFTAIQNPSSANVQTAVKRCIFGLIILDSTLATCLIGLPGLLILLLILPAIWMGKRIYST